METTRYYVDLYRNNNYVSGVGELESTPFMIGAILKDDSGDPLYQRRRMQVLGEEAEAGVIGLGRRWRLQDGRRVGKPKSMLVRIEMYDVGVAVFEVGNVLEVDVGGRTVKAIYGRGKLPDGRSVTFEFHPKTEDEVGEWYPAFVDVGPAVFNPFVYEYRVDEVPFAEPNLNPVPAEEFFPYDED